MPRTVDVEPLIKRYRRTIAEISAVSGTSIPANVERVTLQGVIDDLENSPIPPEMMPVVHGSWRRHRKGGLYCSVCKHDNKYGDVTLVKQYVIHFPRCPFCGAYMDGGDRNGEQ